MIISAIVAAATNRVIGINNDLPWRLPKDLKWFKEKTLHHHVIHGRKSFEALPFTLPKRVNIVVTRDKTYYHNQAVVVHSIDEALAYAKSEGEEEVFILGGEKIYDQTKTLWDKLYLTEVHATPKGDTYFPEVDFERYNLVFDERHEPDAKHEHAFTFKILERK